MNVTEETRNVQKFEEFFAENYKAELNKLAEVFPEKRSIQVDYALLEKYDAELADELITNPYEVIQSAEQAVKNMQLVTSKGEPIAPHVRFYNTPTEQQVLVRDLNSEYLGKFINIEGVVTKITEVKPKIKTAVFQCNYCGAIYKIPQDDFSGALKEPGVCRCERKSYSLLAEQSEMIDYQRMEIQEPLEKVRGAEQTRKAVVLLEDDLTNFILPGDKVQVFGVYRLVPPKHKKSIYDALIDTNNVIKLEREFEELELTEEDLKQIQELAKDEKLYDKIVASIAPSIYGHKEIKEAIALQLLGGTPGKVKPDGMRIRPDMHLLLIGDPGTGKSQLLQYVSLLAPKGIYVSGKSSSAAGLTASAERDELSEGGWTLKAGALVLAAGGMAMIDEFDKMDDQDRASMHDAMESQEIHVAKAGIVATFKANASILAAANPKFGRFDPHELPANQFNIPPTLLSRFDLIFPMMDEINEKRDAELAEHILTSHFVSGLRTGTSIYDDETIKKAEEKVSPVISPELLRKYIAYARKNYKPVLSQEAMDKIKNFYLELRKIGEQEGSIPITARYLEGIVRLAEASAKGRLSNVVEEQDAERAIRLLKTSLKSIGVDPETGRLDIDIIATGTSKSRIDRVKTVYRIIKRLSAEYGEATHEAIVEEAKNQGVKEEDIESILSQLKRNGDVYSPKYGVYKPTEER